VEYNFICIIKYQQACVYGKCKCKCRYYSGGCVFCEFETNSDPWRCVSTRVSRVVRVRRGRRVKFTSSSLAVCCVPCSCVCSRPAGSLKMYMRWESCRYVFRSCVRPSSSLLPSKCWWCRNAYPFRDRLPGNCRLNISECVRRHLQFCSRIFILTRDCNFFSSRAENFFWGLKSWI